MWSENRPIITIGYGNRTITEFLQLLQNHDVRFVGDVRSIPYSRFSPDFSKGALRNHLRNVGIQYVYMGDSLGGNPDDPSVRQVDRSGDKHYVLYDKVKDLPIFRDGLARVERAWAQNVGLALMCSEAKPEACHRTRLIGEALRDTSVGIQHLDEFGALRSQDEIMLRLDEGQQLLPEMGSPRKALKSSKAFSS